MRSVRLRRPDDALYWSSRLREDGCGAGKMAKMLLRLALRDNLDVRTMLEAEQCLADFKKSDKLAVALTLACTEKLWSIDQGRKLVQLICSVQSDCGYREHTDDELILQVGRALNDTTRFADVIKLIHEVLFRSKQAKRPYADFLELLEERTAVQSQDELLQAAVGLLSRISADPSNFTVAEETLVYLVVTWLVCGVFGQGGMSCAADTAVAERLRVEEQVPAWAETQDRRFESSWDGYANMVMMFNEHGRLDPEDSGVLFLAKDGRWVPVIREESGVYLVQSEREPRTFYEVNLAVPSCTCKDFMRRREPCKHVKAARDKVTSDLPFVIR